MHFGNWALIKKKKKGHSQVNMGVLKEKKTMKYAGSGLEQLI